MPESRTFAEVCDALRKTQVYVRSLQSGLDLYLPGEGERYSEAYFRFLRKVVALRTLNISIEDIRDLFIKEKRIMEMLHVDTASDSRTWYLDGCEVSGSSESKLFLTSYDLGVPLYSDQVQPQLNFDGSQRELFSGPAMGEDIRKFRKQYWLHLEKVKRRVQSQKQVLRDALTWADRVI